MKVTLIGTRMNGLASQGAIAGLSISDYTK